MLDWLKQLKLSFLYFLYKKLIVKIVLMNNKDRLHRYKEFYCLNINTTHGPFIFKFYEDRRKIKRTIFEKYLQVFFVEVLVPIDANNHLKVLNSKVIFILKFKLITYNYEVLARVLFNKCLDKYIEELEKNISTTDNVTSTQKEI